jgi:sulfur relay protein TusB/DsrH
MDEDPIVLLGDGVYAQAAAPADMTVVLADDGLVRGVKTLPELRDVDYSQLVQLTVEHAPVVSWND